MVALSVFIYFSLHPPKFLFLPLKWIIKTCLIKERACDKGKSKIKPLIKRHQMYFSSKLYSCLNMLPRASVAFVPTLSSSFLLMPLECSSWWLKHLNFYYHIGDLDGASGIWLWPASFAAEAIWEVLVCLSDKYIRRTLVFIVPLKYIKV